MFPRAANQMLRTAIGAILFTVIIILLLATDSRTPFVRQTPEVIPKVVFLTKPAKVPSSGILASQSVAAAALTTTRSKEVVAENLNFDTKGAINPHPFQWIFVEKGLCDGRRKDLFVLAVVHSAPANIKRRMHIRETWGAQRLYSKTKTALVFALGFSTNASVQAVVKRESHSYRDIIQEDFIDSYKNLTYKGIMWLKFASEYCAQAQYVLKVDDDIFVNIFNLVGHLGRMAKHNSHPPKSIICLVWYGMVVMRDPKNKWYVSVDEYANETFPPYCSGSAYIITRDLVRPMYEQSFKIKFMWVDDWYITGALIEALHVEHTSIASLYVLQGAEMHERLVDGYALFGHVGSMNQRSALWKDILIQKGIEVI